MARRGPVARRGFVLGLRIFLLGIVLLGAALGFSAFELEWSFNLSVQATEQEIRSWGALGVLASIALMVLHSFVPFPAEIVAIANGMLYGPVWGTVITWTGAMLGAFLAFGLARSLGRPFVEMMVRRSNRHVLDEWAAARGGQLVLISRLIPVISFNLINYAAGLTRMSWWTFAWATGIGILPLTTLMVVMGDRIESLTWQMWLLLLAGGLILWFGMLWALSRRRFQPRWGSEGRRAAEPRPRPRS